MLEGNLDSVLKLAQVLHDQHQRHRNLSTRLCDFIDYPTRMTTYHVPLLGFGGNEGLEFSHVLPVVVK